MDKNLDKKRKLKKIIIILLIVLAAVGLIWLAFFAIAELFLNKPITDDISNGDISFYKADYNEDIFKDSVYISKNRNIYFLEYGSGEEITSENLDEQSISAKLFNTYFSQVIDGDYEGYKSLFTEEYLKNSKAPDSFTMQKIYDIEINLFDKKTITENNTEILVETYVVSYKIMENNGTFRFDVGSNTIKPLVFELYKVGETVKINAISFKKNIYE